MQIKSAINTQVCKIENIGKEEIDKINSYIIVFDGNGETSGTMEPMTCVIGKIYTLPKCRFQKDGYQFSGQSSQIRELLFDEYVIKDLTTIKGSTIVLKACCHPILDLNGMLDNNIEGVIHNYGTCDIYINGKLYLKNSSDFYVAHPESTTYEIKNIKATKGHTYLGVSNIVESYQVKRGYIAGGLSGTLENCTSVRLIFITNKYTIHYNANGGTGTMSDTSCTYDKVETLNKNTFTRSGYTFVGWNTKADGSGISYTNIQDVKNLTDQNDVTINLYAQWQKNKQILKFSRSIFD